MSTSTTGTEKTYRDLKNTDLARLRKRLWRMSALLTCGVLLIALAATWVANAVIANNTNKTMLLSQFAVPSNPLVMMETRENAKEGVGQALDEEIRQNTASSEHWLSTLSDEERALLGAPHGYTTDNALEYGRLAETPFRVAMFEDGSISFLETPDTLTSRDDAQQLVETAISTREEGGAKLREQWIEINGRTWMWTTMVEVANPGYDPDDPEGYTISMYASGDLSEYSEEGMFAARIFAFVDITPSVIMLKYLAGVLGVAGIAGCIVLVVVCRKIIDRALKPVGEAWDQQREFLIKASHELKTPMASLSSNLDALTLNADETVASQLQWTDNMRDDIDQLADRACKLLDIVTQPGDEAEG